MLKEESRGQWEKWTQANQDALYGIYFTPLVYAVEYLELVHFEYMYDNYYVEMFM